MDGGFTCAASIFSPCTPVQVESVREAVTFRELRISAESLQWVLESQRDHLSDSQGMSDFYKMGEASEEESLATIARAEELGVTLLDTAGESLCATNNQ